MVRARFDGTWMQRVWPLALAGVALALAELGLALSLGRRYFLSNGEVGRYVLLALTNSTLWTVSSGLLLAWVGDTIVRAPDPSNRQRRLRNWTLATTVPLLSALFWSLTLGRRVRDVPGRPIIVVVVAVMVALGLTWLFERAWRVVEDNDRRQRQLGMFAILVALVALLVNATVLRRLYPAFHLALSIGSVAGTSFAALLLTRAVRSGRVLRGAGAVWLVAALVALPWATTSLSRAPNGRFAVSQTAPITGQWLQLWPSAQASVRAETKKSTATRADVAGAADHAGINLRGQDVLIITVDALRADKVGAYGGRGLSPNMDQLAATSVVFKRAYTPTPHTSYALSSLLTGKFMRPVLDLPNASTEHRTLPQILRRYGYRTAAFFPPAVFFVDAERFASLSRDDFGFEYRKVMFASAQDRVTQLKHYLAHAEAGHPLFVWVHLFEPHEPYTPAERFARGDSAEARYDGEVAQADDGVGGLVRAFRAARANSTVIVTADHGEEFDDHGGRFHGTTLFDEQVRVPLIWSSPGLTQRVIEAPVETIDLATTLLAGLGVPRDARMRGDNLAALLASDNESAAPTHAFADIGESRMATDGHHKLICHADQSECLLFDLDADAQETRNVIGEHPEEAERLRSALAELAGSIPAVEAVALADGVGWPRALARARMGDRSVAPELVPLLGSDTPAFRAGAARACGELDYRPALQVIDQLRTLDPDAQVRAESALSAFALGERRANADVVAVALSTEHEPNLRLRAARLLAEHGDAAGAGLLIETAQDTTAGELDRVAAIELLGTLRNERARPALIALLQDVRLRPAAAIALGHVGGTQARIALLSALEHERYPAARVAEAQALIELKEPRVRQLIERFLGTDTSLPSGVVLLDGLGALSPPSVRGARMNEAKAWRGDGFVCEDAACWPKREGLADNQLAEATLQLPDGAVQKAMRITLALQVSSPESRIRLGAEEHEVAPGAQQVSVVSSPGVSAGAFRIAATVGVRISAIAIVPQRDDVPPPPPEPFDDSPRDDKLAPR